MSPIKAAIEAIKSLEPGQQFSYRKIAIQYGCSRTSLSRDNTLGETLLIRNGRACCMHFKSPSRCCLMASFWTRITAMEWTMLRHLRNWQDCAQLRDGSGRENHALRIL
ncbi:hypothetical protein HBI56_072020 [Parastagonospora nodorum]|uniref:HTH psq-type domain-containing protein n=1 Tax=Phaeosphaeria nodorum (strain SN15 / ATCC MYA-4574 / FGSC 10173) TaxID=321614 RepID=A0A7U2EX20_PHANO|nr:hypothetical protein HBH56_172970 [Parastagonospora nodorum]QRC94645.1 hypothetical protein JI435_078690 [Parastagonospora nodorum SN15]KAH3928266.1 hypothetical protein HBH54_141530 [Parastagonospora nodorum]KAH3945484.1 hypothetical protein HBH53_147050 [Parastagonospora nodorum]KAH3985619.1 hypothetical protein HBH51_016240 [Parastagonospora nodorum]